MDTILFLYIRIFYADIWHNINFDAPLYFKQNHLLLIDPPLIDM